VVPAEAERAVGVLEPAATEAPVGVADAAANAGAAVESATTVRAAAESSEPLAKN
jgi:hypothetical protein